MDSYETGRLVYLILLGCVIGGYFFVSNRNRLGQMARQAALWGLIFVGVIAGVGLWGDIRNDIMPRQTVFSEDARVEVPRSVDGHYYLTLAVNGTNIPFVVDTGATDIVLTREAARKVGIDLGALTYTGVAGTANGQVRTARTTVDKMALGAITDRNVAVWVNQGEMDRSLLGMAYLHRFRKLEISDSTLILER